MVINSARQFCKKLNICLQNGLISLCQKRYQCSQISLPSSKYINSSFEAYEESLSQTPIQPLNPKRLRVGVIGMPNAGKSTLVNTLIGKKLLATSKRIDTTQHNALGILTEDNVQIEFQDTPGMQSKQKTKKFTGSYERAYCSSACMEQADLCIVIADLSERTISQGFLSPLVLLHLLKYQQTPAILVLNKVDKLSNKEDVLPLTELLTAGMVDGVPLPQSNSRVEPLEPISLPKIKTEVFHSLDVIKTLNSATEIDLVNKAENKILNRLRHCRGWPHFKEVFVISALKKQRTKELKQYLMAKAISEPWRYHSKLLTDASPYDIVKGAVRSTLLENLAEEVPYCTNIYISDWKETENSIQILVDLACNKTTHEDYIEKATQVLSFGIRRRLKETFPKEVKISISVFNIDEYSSFIDEH